MTNILFPDHWTAHEALVVSEFLDLIDNAIWARYGTEMLEVLSTEYTPDPQDWECFEE